MNYVPVLHTDHCTLTSVTQSDILVLRQILDDSDTQRFLPELCEEFQTAESLQQFVASFDKLLLQDEGVLWGIRKDQALIGFVAIMDIKTNPTLFYAMHPEYRNQGYMKECLAKVLDAEPTSHFRDRLHTEVYLENIISQRILSSIGFCQYKKDESKVLYKTKSMV